MASPVTKFSDRRRRNVVAAALAVGATLLVARLYFVSLSDLSTISGWALLILFLLLIAYGLRKQLRRHALTVGASTWLQWHIHVGYLAVAVFFLHAGLDLPDGRLDVALWVFTMGLLVSGGLGLIASRWLPSRLGSNGDRVLFERVPAVRARIREEVEALAMTAVSHSQSRVVSDVYLTTLAPFFWRSEVVPHLLGVERHQRLRLAAVREMRRYLDGEGRDIADQIEQRVIAKNELDRQYALQLLLKGWLFVHVPLAFAIMPLLLLHIIVAYAFSGDVP